MAQAQQMSAPFWHPVDEDHDDLCMVDTNNPNAWFCMRVKKSRGTNAAHPSGLARSRFAVYTVVQYSEHQMQTQRSMLAAALNFLRAEADAQATSTSDRVVVLVPAHCAQNQLWRFAMQDVHLGADAQSGQPEYVQLKRRALRPNPLRFIVHRIGTS